MKVDLDKDVYWYRIHPGNSTNYFQAYVWPTHKRFVKVLHVSQGVQGLFVAPAKNTFKHSRCIGTVHLSRPHLTSETIIHEWTHASLSWAKRQKRMDFGVRNTRWGKESTKDEEMVCDNAARLATICMKQLEKNGYKILSSKAIKEYYDD